MTSKLQHSLSLTRLAGVVPYVAPGINVLATTIQCLNLHYANISRKAIKKLAHLTALRQLNMSHCKEMTADLLKVPSTLSFSQHCSSKTTLSF